MIMQRSKWDRDGIHRSHLSGVKRWLGSKAGRIIFENKTKKQFSKLKFLTRRNRDEK